MSVDMPKCEANPLSSPERVRRYIIEHFINSGIAGSRLPPVREIAHLLNVSSTTVDRAYKQLIKEKMIETGVGRGTFVAGNPPITAPRRYCFALSHVVSMGETSGPFYSRFNSSILNAAARFGRRTVIQPFASKPNDWKQAFDALLEERESVDGLILSRYMADLETFGKVIRAYEESGRPVITIHPPNLSWTKNFVSTDFLKTSRRLGRALGESGRKRALFILYKSFTISTSNLPRFAGLQLGLADAGLNPANSAYLAIANDISEEAGYEAMKEQLARNEVPDAVYCFGDYLAIGAMKALEEVGLKVPADVSVVGGTGLDISSTPRALSRLLQPFDRLGEEVISMLINRVDNGCRDIPGQYIDTKFHRGDTTTPAENLLIQKYETESLVLPGDL